MPQQAWSNKRERQYEHIKDRREEARRLDQARQGDRGTDRQQGARPQPARRGRVVALVDGATCRRAAAAACARGTNAPRAARRRAALQRGQAHEHPGPLEDEQAAAASARSIGRK